MITVKTLSGSYTMDSFIARPIKASDVLTDAKVCFPHLNLTTVLIRKDEIHQRLGPEDFIPDNATVIVLADQPVDA